LDTTADDLYVNKTFMFTYLPVGLGKVKLAEHSSVMLGIARSKLVMMDKD
jgi:hypothetical protein